MSTFFVKASSALELGAPQAVGTTPVGGAGDPTAGLSSEALLAYIAAKLNDTDGEINRLLDHQKVVENEQAKIQQLTQEINSLQSKITKDSSGNGHITDPAECAKLETDVEDLINYIQKIDPGCPQIGQLMALHDRMMATGTGPLDANGNQLPQDGSGNVTSGQVAHGYYNGNTAPPGQAPNGGSPVPGDLADHNNDFGEDELKDFADALQGVSNDLSSGAQIEMIQIQSKVSDRSTAIQLATNIMQTLHDAEMKTVGNIH